MASARMFLTSRDNAREENKQFTLKAYGNSSSLVGIYQQEAIRMFRTLEVLTDDFALYPNGIPLNTSTCKLMPKDASASA